MLVSDPHSPFATTYGEETQHNFLAQTLISLVIAQKHSLHNPSFTNVLHDLHRCSPFTAISFASEVVAIGEMPKRWSWLPLRVGSAGTGNYGDILTQMHMAIDRCVTEEDTRSFTEQAHVRSNASSTLLVNIPIALNDPRFPTSVRDTGLYIGTYYPSATAITVRANGCLYPRHLGGRFLVQASCLYPLQPALFPTVQGEDQVQGMSVSPLSSAMAPTNGQHPLNSEEPVSATHKKATRSVTRASKTAPTPLRRSSRRQATTN